MTIVRQVSLIPAGCQPWNLNVVASKGSRFAYAATLAIYIYELNPKINQFYLHSIMSEHKKTITSIAWHVTDQDLLVSGSMDVRLCVWNVSQRRLVASLKTPCAVPTLVAWFPTETNCVAYTDGKGPVNLWRYISKEGTDNASSQTLKEVHSLSAHITQICWHRSVPGRLAIGHADGTISLYIRGKKPQRHIKPAASQEKDQNTDEDSAITVLQWDPLSPNYLLMSSVEGHLQLVDTSGEVTTVVTRYTTPSKAVTIKCVAWLDEAPGAFISGDAETGVLRIWTVSKEKPLENVRLKQTGFQALCILPTEMKSLNSSQRGSPGTNEKIKFLARVVCLFHDGGVGVYGLRSRSWEFFRDMGHLETIFDCQFKPDNCDLLATASFDGTIKVWNVNTMEAVSSSPGDESIIYSLSWAPADVNCIAAATSKKGFFVWNISKGCITRRIEDHGKGVYVYCVAWNQKDARKIASCGADCTCMVHLVDGKLTHTFKHPSTVYGCDWNPNNENILATACDDGNIRIFYEGSGTSQPLKVLSGHLGKVFRVKWSPLKEGILCSTSDDCTVCVWDYTSASVIKILQGHTNFCRGLLWSPELPNIVISGSWDYTIRVWDINDGVCIDVIEDHGGDVYGLACHAQRPFSFASTSRDSTVRLWSVLPLVSRLFLKLLADRPWDEVFCPPASMTSSNGELGLYGGQSKAVKEIVGKYEDRYEIRSIRTLSNLFCPPTGVNNMWDLVSVLKREEVDNASYKNGIIHRKDIVKFTAAKAQEKELVKMTRFGAGGVGAPSKDDCLQTAADAYLFTGNLKKYCEIKTELGQWQEALAVAPGVSMDYWHELSSRYIETLSEENNAFVVPLCISSNNMKQLLDYYKKQNEIDQAYLVSVAAADGVIMQSNHKSSQESKYEENRNENSSNYESLVKENIKCLSERYMLNGNPVLSACCRLSTDSIQEALYSLLRGHELELAVSLAIVLNERGSSLSVAVTYLAWRCVQKNDWYLALDVLSLSPESENQKAQICSYCSLPSTEKNQLYEKAGFPTIDECAQKAKDEEANHGSLQNVVQYYLLSHEPKMGLDIGLKYVTDTMSDPTWKLEPIFQILQMMAAVQSLVFQDTSCDRHRFELQVYCAYVGALMAIRQGYHPVVVPLLTTAIRLLRRVHNPSLAVNENLINSVLHSWMESQSDPRTLSEDYLEIYQDLKSKVFEDSPSGDVGVTVVSGSHLPRHSDHHRCYFRGTAIQGPVFFLEDCKSAISLNDALMWAKVNPFSPLGTGLRINPF